MSAMEIRVIVGVVMLIVVTIIVIFGIRTNMGKATRGTLHVPKGKILVPIRVCDDGKRWQLKYGQIFELVFMPGEHTAMNAYTGEELRGTGALMYRGEILGFADSSETHVIALTQLAKKHKKVVVSASVATLEQSGEPQMNLNLPDNKWFHRALKD